jgi:hypothetical protein
MRRLCILYCICLVLITNPLTRNVIAKLGRQPDSCPSGHIEASSETCCGSECKFNGSVAGWDPAIKPIVKWTVSAGKIVSGQGTWSIKVDAGKDCDKPIIVTLNVTGDNLPKACEVKETYTTKLCSSKER